LGAFRPEQIQPDTGNQGIVSANNPDIHFSRSAAPAGAAPAATVAPSNTATPAAPPIRERMERVIDTLIYNFQEPL
jgi:hypothetical protein